ncbi:MAG: N-acetylmuramoyl-L-alanine amidase [Deltaproteobacteria bacterium]|nr:MAG: N-acetylmuramoyl-L-alanine amidase [Deltaproteobacteria bacterium]
MKSRKVHISLFLFFLLVSFSLVEGTEVWGETSSGPATLLKKADDCRKSLYRSGKKRKYRHSWLKCIRLYESIYTRYPKSEQAPWALYREARLYAKLYGYSGMQQDLDDSLERFTRLVEEYETHRLADDAQYRIGEIYYNHKKDPSRAYVEFLKVDVKYPSGDMRPNARARLDELAAILSKKNGQGGENVGSSTARELALVKDIRHWSTPTYTRVVIDLERSVKYTSNVLKKDPAHKKPRRLYVDLESARVSADMDSSIPIEGGLLHRARAGQFTKDRVRVVLDIDSINTHKIFHLYDPFRIVVDVRGDEEQEVKSKSSLRSRKRRTKRESEKARSSGKTVSLARQLGLGVERIVIDPGHGGKDPGTYIKGGFKEKNIVLSLAKVLARKIEQRLDCEAILTRDSDVFLPLERRTAFANMKKADLFISLHVNSYKQKGVHGLETYFLNLATDARAVMVAARENATSEKNISDLQKILNDLMLNTKISESSRLAREVQEGMIAKSKRKYSGVRDLGVKQAPFYVLIGAEMPAILVETGFITNPKERSRLVNKKYQENLAEGIASGIEQYIKSIEQAYKGG